MSDSGKRDPLLSKSAQKQNRASYHRCDEWWEDSASSSSSSDCSSRSDQSQAEWENHVSPKGELFFCKPYSKRETQERQESLSTELRKENNPPEKGILVKLIRRRSSRRSVRKKGNEDAAKPQEKVEKCFLSSGDTPVDAQGRNLNEVIIHVSPDKMGTLSRRTTPLESLLGLVTIVDGSCLIVSGFMSNFSKFYEGKVQIGDLLHSIDGVGVSSKNVDGILGSITGPKEVVVKFENMEGISPEQDSGTEHSRRCAKEAGFSVLYAKLDLIVEGGPPDQGIMYSFPQLTNSLTSIRGAFFTLHQLLPDVVAAHPVSTSVKVKDQIIHVVYSYEGKEILLLSVPNTCFSQKEAVKINSDIVRCLCFTYQSLSRCFTNPSNRDTLNEFFTKIFYGSDIDVGSSYLPLEQGHLLLECNRIPLPKEAQIHIDDALNELEANDITAYETEKLYSVIGSAYFHKGYMVCSHLCKDDLLDLVSMLRQFGILSLSRNGVKELIYWKEVYPSSCQRGFTSYSIQPYSVPHGRWFILVVGKDYDLIAVLFESGGCTKRLEGNPGPDVLYVDEAIATLHHVKKLGIQRFTSKWIENGCEKTPIEGQQMQANVTTTGTLRPSELHSSHSTLLSSFNTFQKLTDAPPLIKSKSEPHIVRAHYDYDRSPDSSDQYYQLSAAVEGGPVLGRRAERERAIETNSQSLISESEVSDDSDWTREKRLSEGEVLNASNTILSDAFSFSSRMISGTNSTLFHFIYLDSTEGILLSNSSRSCNNTSQVMTCFRHHVHFIHNVLMNTVSFKKIKMLDNSTSIVNKSLVAIKEHGILFECPSDDKSTLTYWIIGRLFFVPHPREVYVCYEDTCPQNMVEIAFRLALSASV